MKNRKEWEGTSTDLLDELEGDSHVTGYVSESVMNSKAWPKGPHILSGRLRKAATFLHTVGIEVTFPRESKRRGIVIKKLKK